MEDKHLTHFLYTPNNINLVRCTNMCRLNMNLFQFVSVGINLLARASKWRVFIYLSVYLFE